MDEGSGKIDRTGLRPELRGLMEAVDAAGLPSLDRMTPAEGRESSEAGIPALWGDLEPVAAIEDLEIETPAASLPARLYRPAKARGTVLFFHGGGWVIGSLATHDGGCRLLANATPANILSVEYRKGPEHPFPAAVIDADASLDWLVANGARLGLDTNAIVVAGESAGATLAAVVARHARDRDVSLAGQALIYPPTDSRMDTPSYRDNAIGFNLTRAAMRWFYDHYVNSADRGHPDAAPLLASDLARLAPAYLVTVEFDPLRDEGRAYAARLIEAGNDVTYVERPGLLHGVWVMNAVTPATGEMVRATARWIADRFR
jgi:acetyl esterase